MSTTTFAYRVRDRAGTLREGTLDAESERLLVAKLREMGYTPVSIAPVVQSVGERQIRLPSLGQRIGLKDVAVFSRQFATMINSGLPLLRALAILEEQAEHAALGAVIGSVRVDVERGSSLSRALAQHPKVFNQLYVAMVRSGEVGGVLDSVLVRLADTLERQVELRRKVRAAMTYPAVVMVLVLLIVTGMLLFVIPMFSGLYDELGGTMPLPTRVLLAVSAAARSAWFVVVGVEVGAVALFRRWIGTAPGRARWDAIKLRAPVFGGLVRKTALARFARTFSALIRSGVPLLEALDIVAVTSGNAVVAAGIADTQTGVARGESIARRLAAHPVFPPMVVQMMAVGEETGALDEMLDKIADFYDHEVESTVEALTSLIEPLLIVVMGLVVGAMVIALYLPMFNIINIIQ